MDMKIICPALKAIINDNPHEWLIEDLLLPHLDINHCLTHWLAQNPLPIASPLQEKGFIEHHRENDRQILKQAFPSSVDQAFAQVWAMGFFAADPFLSLYDMVACFQQSNIAMVCNFPSVGFHDVVFRKLLEEGNIGETYEQEQLAAFKRRGFQIAWCAGEKARWKIADVEPDVIVNLDTLNNFDDLSGQQIEFSKQMIWHG